MSCFESAPARVEATTVAEARWRGSWSAVAVLGIYVALAAVYTWPLLPLSGSRIASDPGDPVLNASILRWNAITVPFSEEWWNPPYFYPSGSISAFTENLQGLTPFSTPIFWVTRNPLTTYNISLFLTWPLSAFAVYLLVRFMTARSEVAFVAGLAFGFSPYRTAELGHLQMLVSYWLPLALLGLHGYLAQRRLAWLVLFGVAWLMQSLANGYLMLFGGVLIAMWLAYFCSTRQTWRAAPTILIAWVVVSLPLLAVMLKYRTVHAEFGVSRNLSDPLGFSAPVRAFGEVSRLVWLWAGVLPESSDNLFPGITALLVLVVAWIAVLRRYRQSRPLPPRRTAGRALLLALLAISASATLFTVIYGPWRIDIAGVVIRMSRIDRALLVAIVCSIPLVPWRAIASRLVERRRPFVFYTGATLLMAAFSCGPVLRVGLRSVLDPAPYRLLMALPGFDSVRVPTRFWMLGILCLAVAAGLALARLAPRPGRRAQLLAALATVGVLLDGWLVGVPMAKAPESWPRVERRDRAEPILELPLGPAWDAAATYRSIGHRRRVVNGVSGYDPPHYDPLQAGLNARDPSVLLALTSLGALDVVVDGAADPDGSWGRYVSGVEGATLTGGDGVRTVYRLPPTTAPQVRLGEALPIARARAFRHDAAPMIDGQASTEWGDGPQQPGQWVMADLGGVYEVAGITHLLADYARDFPRVLAIELSSDGVAWTDVWRGGTVGQAFLSAVHQPRRAEIVVGFPARPARFVRLRQLARHDNLWRIAELRVHGPAR